MKPHLERQQGRAEELTMTKTNRSLVARAELTEGPTALQFADGRAWNPPRSTTCARFADFRLIEPPHSPFSRRICPICARAIPAVSKTPVTKSVFAVA